MKAPTYTEIVGAEYQPAVEELIIPNDYCDGPTRSLSCCPPCDPVPESDVKKEMPRYTIEGGGTCGSVYVSTREFAYLGWPILAMAPVNKSAEAVKGYFAENREHPNLLPSPWCALAQKLVLPKLPRIKSRHEEQQERVKEQQKVTDSFIGWGNPHRPGQPGYRAR